MCSRRPEHAPLTQTARLLSARHVPRSFLLFKENYPNPILSFFKGARSYLVILFFRSNFHYFLFSPTFENDFALFHLACGLAAGASKHTSAPHGEIGLSLCAISRGHADRRKSLCRQNRGHLFLGRILRPRNLERRPTGSQLPLSTGGGRARAKLPSYRNGPGGPALLSPRGRNATWLPPCGCPRVACRRLGVLPLRNSAESG